MRTLLAEGWRYPTERDLLTKDDMGSTESVESILRLYPSPYHVQADIDGDGRLDDVWLLVRRSETEGGVFVYLHEGTEIVKPWGDWAFKGWGGACTDYFSTFGNRRS